MSNSSKLIIFSTRLPVSVSKVKGVLHYSQSAGGLATGVSYVSKSRNSVWIGWPGIPSDGLTKKDKVAITKELKKYDFHPVFLTQAQVDSYYSGYCNATLWPLFHYFTNKARFDAEYWKSYKQINALFLKESKQFVTKEAQLWVHDYQLMLLPELLRKQYPEATIGFFLHTPFPSFEIFRLLPEREELLRGLIGADLVGFHTYDYVRHFLSSVQRILGYENELGVINLKYRVTLADAFPIGIDYKKFAKGPKNRKVRKILRSFDLFNKKIKVLLAVDRADYSKGIPARLDAFEHFLQNNPEYHSKLVMILLAVPSREDVDEYQELRSTIEQKVSHINGEYSTVDWSPINYRYQSLPFDELSALYALADVMLVTPLRDGMNLVAKEYVATRNKDGGVLILSEMAGVASELPESLQVNPNDTVMVANSIKTALEMPMKEQKKRMKAMQSRIAGYTIAKWAEDYINQLSLTHKRLELLQRKLNRRNRKQIISDYQRSKSRLILLDYDGTLKEFVASPKASLARPSRKVRTMLKRLTNDEKNRVVIISGRPRSTLEDFFKDIGLGIVAEHGGWILGAGGWVKSSLASKKWKKQIKPMLDEFASRTPGAIVEEKDFSLVWHYRQVTPDLAYVRSEELKMELHAELEDSGIGVFEGNKMVEIKPKRMHKGAIVTDLLSEEKWDFILAIGDDYTDEDMFRALPEVGYSINVGNKSTEARYQVGAVNDVIKLLEELA